MLIAFNAAPGTVAPTEQGPYGVYAQSLAEMIRTGGLPLPDVFDRVRLRVSEASKGAQVPWDEQKVDAAFMFFDRAPDAPARRRRIRSPRSAASRCAISARRTPTPRRSSATRCRAIEDFLAAYPDDPLAKRVRAIARGAARGDHLAAHRALQYAAKPIGPICSVIRAGRMPPTRVAGLPFSPPRWSRRRLLT